MKIIIDLDKLASRELSVLHAEMGGELENIIRAAIRAYYDQYLLDIGSQDYLPPSG